MFLIVHTVDVEICHGFSIELLQHQLNKLKLFKGYTAANCAFMYLLRGCSQMTSSFLGGTLTPPLPLVIIRHFWSTPPLPLCAMTSFIAYYRTK